MATISLVLKNGSELLMTTKQSPLTSFETISLWSLFMIQPMSYSVFFCINPITFTNFVSSDFSRTNFVLVPSNQLEGTHGMLTSRTYKWSLLYYFLVILTKSIFKWVMLKENTNIYNSSVLRILLPFYMISVYSFITM